MLAAVLSIFILALLSPLIAGRLGRASGWVLALLPALLAGYFALQIPAVSAGQTVLSDYPWLGWLDVRLAFALDGLSLLMALLITGLGALVVVFAGGYLPAGPDKGRFYAFLLTFMGSMLGLVLTDDLIVLFVFWELTSFSSFLLIGHDSDRAAARAAALQALLVTSGGGLALLAGLVLLGQVGGSLRFSELIASGAGVSQHPLYVPILALILLGAFTKSAQFPFHFWLPNAMEAPAPVSAYLHAATMVKAGVFLLARVHPILGGTAVWQYSLVLVGGATVLAASLLPLHQKDLKRLLAYSTVSALGVMTLLLGLGTAEAVGVLVIFLLAHAFYKGALFLVAGAIDHATGERQVDRVGGLWRTMPAMAATAAVAGASMAGLPPLFGFMGKEGFLKAVVESPWPVAASVLAVAASAVLAAVALQVGLRPFIGRPRQTVRPPHPPGLALLLGPALLAAGGAVLGLASGLAAPLAGAAAAAVLGRPAELHLGLWHGLNLPLGLSAVGLVGGLVLYFRWDAAYAAGERLRALARTGPERLYELMLKGLAWLAATQTRLLQSGYLRLYLLLVVLTTVLLVGGILTGGSVALPADWADARPHEIILAALIVLASLAAIRSQSWLAAVAALGVVGLGVAAIFILFAAPDLAMTQFLIETLTVILFVLIIYHLPRLTPLPARRFKIVRGLAALASGTIMSVLVLAASAGSGWRDVSDFYLRHSLSDGFGRNVVNVILVDFRAFDTLGEITVLAVAGLGVYALVRTRRAPGRRP